MANVLYTCCTTVQSELQNSVTLTSLDAEVSDIADASIVIRKLALREKEYEIGHCTEAMPGILIVPGIAPSPPSAGVNTHDDVFYTIDIAIISRDYERLAGLNTYTQWTQSIKQRMNLPTISWPSDASSGIVWHVKATQADHVNDWRWVRYHELVSLVQLKLTSREPRG